MVRDRFAFVQSGAVTHEILVKALEEEVRAKEVQSGRKQVGF